MSTTLPASPSAPPAPNLLTIEGVLDATDVATVAFSINLDSHTDPLPATGTPITIGTQVNDSFSAPNSANTYTFTVNAGAQLYFDSLNTDQVTAAYTITGPRGVEIPGTLFTSADGTQNQNPSVINLPLAGTYQLTITNASYVGSYSFNLLDITQPAAVLPTDGSILQTTLGPSNSTQIYQFNATAGTDVYLAASANYNYYQDIDVRLIDPLGNQIQGPFSIGNNILSIPVTGTYTLLVEGNYDNAYYSGAIGYSLSLAAIANPAPVALSLGQDINGQIAAGSEVNTYTLNLASAASLVLSSFTSDTTLNLALIGPDGTLSVTNLGQALGYGHGSPVFQLAAGSYTLAVSSTNALTTPSYGFALFDMATAQPISSGTAVNATLAPSIGLAAYTITADAGTQLRVYSNDTSNGYYPGYANTILVLDPNGAPLAPPAAYRGNVATFAITETGTYTILYEGQVGAGVLPSTTYTLTAYVDPPPAPLALNTITSGTLATTQSIAQYTFTLATATSLVFDSLTNNYYENWTLTGPGGYSLTRSFYSSGSYELGGTNPLLPLNAGTYTLTFSNATSSSASYSFQMISPTSATPLTLGTPLNLTDTGSGQTLLYTFNATAGVPLNLTTSDPSNYLSVRVFDPYGDQVLGPQQTGQQLINPGATGVYTVLIESRVWDGTPRPFNISINSVPQQTTALSGPNGLSGPTGPYSAPGQIGNALAFTGLDSIVVANQPAIALTSAFTMEAWINVDSIDEGFVPILSRIATNGVSYQLGLTNGDQLQLRIFSSTNGNSYVTSNYGVAPGGVWTQVAAVINFANNTAALYINGVLATQSGINTYTLVDNAAPLVIGADQTLGWNNDGAFQGLIQQVQLWTVARSATDILTSYDTALAGTESGLALYLPLDEPSGSATVADLGPSATVGTVEHAFDGLDNVVEGRITAPFGTSTYSFSLTQTTSIVIDGLSDNTAFRLTLTGPNGLSLTRNITYSDGDNFNGNPVITIGPGSYTIVVSATTGAIGGFGFRLLNLAEATAIATDTTINATQPEGFTTSAFSFTASAGDQLIFNDLGGSTNAIIRIIDPLGNLLINQTTYGSDTGIPVLNTSGTYILLVEGNTNSNRNGPQTFSFQIDRTVTNNLTMTLGAANPTPGPIWNAGGGVVLTGADEVTFANSAIANQTGSFTLQATIDLVRFDGYTPIVTMVSSDGSKRAYGLYVNADGSIVGTTQDSYGDQGYASTGGLVQLNTVATIAMVVDRIAGTMTLYLNGTAVQSSNIRTQAGISVNGPLVIGATNESSPGYGRFEGAIANVQLWSVALSNSEMAANATTAPLANSADLMLDLPFAEGSGGTSANLASPGGVATLVNLNPFGITGDITHAGQSNAYSFTLTQTTQVVVDSLSGSNMLTWSLSGPYGGIAGNLLSNTNGYNNGYNPVYVLQAGTYTFTISSTNGGTGTYNMRLIDIAASATSITPGTAVSGVLNPANNTQVYNFAAVAGQTLFMDPGTIGGEVTFRLIGPTGNQVYGPSTISNQSITLNATGTYTILLEGRSQESGRSSYSFNAVLSPIVTNTLTLGTTVQGNLLVPSEQDVYTFTLATATQAVFNSLTNDGNINWTLTGPAGAIVNTRYFNASDGQNIGGSTALQLAAGTYTLTVQGYLATTGAYSFRLLDTSTGTAAPLDTPITGTIGDNGQDINVYQFTATANERVIFEDTASSNGNTTWRLMDQYGNLVFGPTQIGNGSPITLHAGTYTLLVEGAIAETADATYGFTIASVPQQTADGQTTQDFDTTGLLPYTLGNSSGTAASLTTGATGNALQLTDANGGNQNNAVYFPATTNGPLASVTIDLDVTIAPASISNLNSSLVIALLDTSTWGNSGVGPDLFTNAGLANSLGISLDANNNYGSDGSSNHIAIRGGGGLISQQYITPASVDLSSGGTIHATITVTQIDGGADVTVVLTPQGGVAFTAVSNLFVAGYQLNALRVAIGGQSYYSNTAQTIDNVAISAVAGPGAAAPITVGQTVSGSILVPNAVEYYSFDITQPTTVVFDALTPNSVYLYWTLNGPSGLLASRYLSQADSANLGGSNLLTLAPGHYVISIAASYQTTGAYSFRLLDTSTATPIAIGPITATPVTATFTLADQTDLFSFTGTAGQDITFYNPGGQPYIFYRILDPNGLLISGPNFINNNTGSIALTLTGTYLIELEGYYSTTGTTSMQFQLVDSTPQINPLTLNQTFTGAINAPGQQDIHTFTLTQTTIVYADSLSYDGALNWVLTGPQGKVAGQNFTNTDGTNRSGTDPVAMVLVAGTYQFIVTDQNNTTDSYSFRLLDLSVATPLSLGVDTPISLNPADGTQAYSFTATAGEVVHLSASGGNNVSLRLIDSTGRVVTFLQNASQGINTPALALAGTYTLLIEGTVSAGSGAQSLTVRADQVINGINATTLGAQISATIATPGQSQIYTFTVATASNVLIDALGYDGRFTWTLTSPNGSTFSRNFNSPFNTNSYYTSNPLQYLAPGTYTLTISALYNATGTVLLNLIDAATAPVITPGVPITGALAPVGAASVYQMQALAGESFYFQSQQQSGGSFTWQLVDPNGNTIFNQGYSSGEYKFTVSGTYYLLILDENNDYSPPLTYGVNVFDNTPGAAVPITAPSTAPAPDLQVQQVTATAPGGIIESGAPITISWQDTNTGQSAASGSWIDRIVITNLTNGYVIDDQTVPSGVSTLAAGGTLAQSVTLSLPSGADGTGQLQISVTTDAANSLPESNLQGTALSNNTGSTTVTSTLAAYPDLIASNLVVSPTGQFTPGASVTVSWTTTNEGNASTGVGWTDTLTVLNKTTANQIGTVSVVQPDNAPLAAGASVQRSVVIIWPPGGQSTGDFSFVVNVNATNAFTEANPAGTGLSNDRTELDVLSAPDIVVQNLQQQPGTTAQAGGQLTLTWTDTNTGTSATPNGWTDQLQIVSDTTYQQIVLLAVPALPPGGILAPGASLTQSVTVSLPDSASGTGDLQVTITSNRDVNNTPQLTEADQNGNYVYGNYQRITVTSAAAVHADLTASAPIVPASGVGGSPITVGYTVTNTGVATTNATSWTDEIVLSPTAGLNSGTEIVLGSFIHTGALAAGASYSASYAVTLPTQLNGTYYIAVLTDPAGAVTEPTRGSEYITTPKAIALTSPYSDLITQAVSAPGFANNGDLITITWRVGNLGTAATAAGGWTDQVYLSSTDNITSASILLGTLPHTTALSVGGTYTAKATFALPGDVIGPYHIIVVTNANSGDYENGLTANNTAEAPGTLQIGAQPTPDLAVTAVSLPSNTVPGVPTTVSFTITNVGQAIARGPWNDQLVLLTGANFATATMLATIERSFDLAIGASYTVTATVNLPALPDGAAEIAVTTDVGDGINEGGSYANNTLNSAAFTTVHPDLVPLQVQAPTSIISGQTMTVSWVTENNGTGPALPGWTETVSLLAGGVSTVIGTVSQTNALAAGASVAHQISYAIPISLSGAYQIVVTIDSGNDVTEVPKTKTDNTASVPITIGLAPYAVLDVNSITAPATTIADPATVTIGWSVTNNGNGAGITGSWSDEVVLSASGVVGSSDNIVLATTAHTGGLAVGASYSNSVTVSLPPGFNGRYQLFVVTNVAGNVFQNGNTAGNTAQLATPFDVIPYAYAKDIVTSVTPGANPASGQIVDLSWVVQNQGIGTTDTSEWVDSVYLSQSPTGAGQVLLGQYDHLGYLTVGQSYTRTAEVTLPNGISGPYYFIVVTAASSSPNFNTAVPSVVAQGTYGSPYEFVYANTNVGVSAVTHIALTPAPDLVVTNVTIPPAAEEGTAINVSWTVANQGLGIANGNWTDTVVLQQVGDANPGTVVGTFTFTGPLIAGQSYSRTGQIVLPLHITGAYNIIIVPNAGATVYEGANNGTGQATSTSPIVVSAQPRPDLVVTSITAPATINAGAAASVSFVVTNVGSAGTNTALWTDNVYLSLEAKVTSDSILISSLQNVTALTSGESYSNNATSFVVPLRYAGNVYIIVETDAGSTVDEFPHDGNNITVQQIYVVPAPLADLVVSKVAAPALAFPNNQVTVNFTVTNLGAGPTTLANFAEQVWLDVDKQRPNPGLGDILLTEVQYNGGILATGAGYDQSITVTLPSNVVSGTYYLTVWVDPYETLIQSQLATNINPDDPNEIQNDNYKAGNSATGGTEIIGLPATAIPTPLPDVAIVAVTADPTGQATQNFSFSWTVTNTGPGIAAAGGNTTWNDSVYLANAPTLAAATNIWSLGSYAALSALNPGQSYTNAQTVLLNPAARGTWLIVVTALSDNTNISSTTTGNAKTNVTGGVPDLVLSNIAVPASVNSGDPLTVSYTVTNTSATPIWSGTGYWSDVIYISRDPTFIANRATLLGIVQHANTGVGAFGSYTDSLTAAVPAGIGGTFYVYVFINQSHGSLPLPTGGDNDFDVGLLYAKNAYEDPEGNTGSASFAIVYAEPKLVVTNFVVPPSITAGSTVSVSFTVSNIGNRATRESGWMDAVFLSTDASLDNGDYLLTLEQANGVLISSASSHNGVLAAGASYDVTITFTMPFEISGPFYLIAATDTGYGASGYSLSTISPRLNGLGGSATGSVPLYNGTGFNTAATEIAVVP